jgi:glycosyltransferase involved in cell wall biosynthesis
MTRILYVIKNLKQGGTEEQLLQIWAALPERFDKRLCLMNPDVHYPDAPPHLVARDVGALARVIDEVRPDVIHSFRDRVNFELYRALQRTACSPAWLPSVRGRPIRVLDLVRTRLLCGRAYRVTVNSEGVAATLRRVGVHKLAMTHNLTDTGRFRPPTDFERARARGALGIAADAFVWVLPARLSWVKNQLGLAAAVAALGRPLVALLAGRPRDRIPSWALPRLAQLLRVDGKLRLLGAQSEMGSIYAASDALVLPSFAEAMPNVILEAHLCELPAVVTAEANRDGVVLDGETGFVAPLPEPWGLARAMRALMDLGPEERRAFGARGRERVLAGYDRTAVLARLISLYDEAAGASQPGRQHPVMQ